MKPSSARHALRAFTQRRQQPQVAVASRRWLHTPLPTHSLPFDIDKGLKPFLSASSTRRLAEEWQEGLLDRLNEQVQGTDCEGQSLFDTIVALSKDKTQVVPFNLASEALNNSFFLNGLRAPKSDRNAPVDGSELSRGIQATYGSTTQLISHFSSAAMGMFSSGYMWLVCDNHLNLSVCATFGGGTILVQNRQQRGDWGALLAPPLLKKPPGNTTENMPEARSTLSDMATPPGRARAFSTSVGVSAASTASGPSYEDAIYRKRDDVDDISRYDSQMPEEKPIGSQIFPLLALQVAERAFMPDYGVWGKEQYIRNFWKVVNWDRVEAEFSRRKQIVKTATGLSL